MLTRRPTLSTLAATCVCTLIASGTTVVRAGTIVYVDDDALLGGDGTAWNSAFRHLQDGLDKAIAGDEVWVAGGLYTPDQDEGGRVTPGDRSATFQLITGVALRGGYAGLANPGNPDARDIDLYETILSGDLSGNDGPVFAGNEENSYNVVTGSGTNATAVLWGFIIVAGNANGTELSLRGGGLSNVEGSPTIRGCRFRNNSAWLGGGMNNEGGAPTVSGCVFEGNSAGFSGGAIRGWESSPRVSNCLFAANKADSGGAMWYGASASLVEGCTFVGNAANEGNGLTLASCCPEQPSTFQASGCIFWNGGDEIVNTDGSTVIISYSDVQGGLAGTGNIDADPLFVDPGFWDDNGTPDDPADDFWVDGDYRLTADSPCVDAGDPGFFGGLGETDLDGRPRKLCGRVDMGASEFGIGDYDCDRQVNLTDFAGFQNCMTGPGGKPYPVGCEALDFDADGLITLHDFAAGQSHS